MRTWEATSHVGQGAYNCPYLLTFLVALPGVDSSAYLGQMLQCRGGQDTPALMELRQ